MFWFVVFIVWAVLVGGSLWFEEVKLWKRIPGLFSYPKGVRRGEHAKSGTEE